MASYFQIQTLVIVAFSVLFASGLCMGYYFIARRTFPGFGAWALGANLSALSFFLLALRDIVPDFISIIVANGLGILSVFLMYYGFKSFAEEKVEPRLHIIGMVLYSLILFPYFTYVSPDLNFRIVLVSFATGAYFFVSALVHYRAARRKLNRLNLLVVGSLAALVCLRLSRGLFYLFSENIGNGYMSSGILSGLFILVLIMLSVCLVIGLMQLNSERLEAENDELIIKLQRSFEEIRTLKGILPICMYCKKIRDDMGYWNQLEMYISSHSEADFSHAICPGCADKHYPELNLYRKPG